MNIVQHLRPLGVTAEGIDLGRADVFEIRLIKLALARYGMLVFRQQMLTNQQLSEFAGKVGSLQEPGSFPEPVGDVENVASFTNLRNAGGSRAGIPRNETDYWHSHKECFLNPPSLSAMYCVIPPSFGGATSFASTRIEDLSLSPELVATLSSQQVTYLPGENIGGEDDADEGTEIAHPLIQQSPVTGRKSIYISEKKCTLPVSG